MNKIKKFLAMFVVAMATVVAFQGMNSSLETVKVSAAVKKVNKGTHYAKKGSKFKITVFGARGKVTFSSSNKKVATVDSSGKIVTKGLGVANITAKASNLNNVWKIIVENPKLNVSKKTCSVGDKLTFRVNGTRQKVTWKSLDTKITNVTSKGVVVPKTSGTVLIMATLGSTKASLYAKVTVTYNKYLKVTQKKTPMGLVALVKNNAKVLVNFRTKTTYKDAKKKALGTTTNVSLCLAPGKTAVLNVTDSKIKNKFVYFATSIENSYKPTYTNMASNVGITDKSLIKDSKDGYGYKATFTNKDKKNDIKNIYTAVVYYKGDSVVGVAHAIPKCTKKGSKDTVNYSKPYYFDSNDKIVYPEYDKAELYLEYAYR